MHPIIAPRTRPSPEEIARTEEALARGRVERETTRRGVQFAIEDLTPAGKKIAAGLVGRGLLRTLRPEVRAELLEELQRRAAELEGRAA